MIEVVEFVDAEGNSPFARWFNRLDRQAAAKVTVALLRMEQGNLSNAKALGGVQAPVERRDALTWF